MGKLFANFEGYDVQATRKEAREEGIKEGIKEGRSQGESIKLIELINRKLQKSKEPETIAEELEESLENVKRICEAIFRCGLEADATEIYEQLQSIN